MVEIKTIVGVARIKLIIKLVFLPVEINLRSRVRDILRSHSVPAHLGCYLLVLELVGHRVLLLRFELPT